ncbi:RICIN domain-containing protein [Kibdelosporangium aridum]|uniref:RICIN domain-containing protein n=1 Tax=Kibdelosporangium aridum TaxID=2030 RepID=UPI0035E6B34A
MSRLWVVRGVVAVFVLAGCTEGTVGVQPVGLPVEFSINSNGEIAVSQSRQIVTPLGTFTFEVAAKKSLVGSSSMTMLAINHYVGNELVQSRYSLDVESEVLKVCISGQAEVSPNLQDHAVVVSAIDPATRITVVDLGTRCSSSPAEYVLKVQHSGKCLDIPFADPADQVKLQQYTCHGAPNQRWLLQQTSDGYYRIKSVSTGKCLDIPSGSKADGVVVQQFACHEGPNQQWSIWPSGIVARNSGKCLDIRAGAMGDHGVAQQFSCHGGPNQRWSLNG